MSISFHQLKTELFHSGLPYLCPSSDSVFAQVRDYQGLRGIAVLLGSFLPTPSPNATPQPPTLLPWVWPCLSSPSALDLGWNGMKDIRCLPVCLTQLQGVSLCPFVPLSVCWLIQQLLLSAIPTERKQLVLPVDRAPLLWIKEKMLRPRSPI